MDLMLVRRRIIIMAGAFKKFTVTAAAGIVVFVTNVVKPSKVTCAFSPVQSGSGDPSPTNVRPISGWTGCEIVRTGKNMYDGTYESGKTIDSSGQIADNANYYLCSISPIAPGTYTISASESDNTANKVMRAAAHDASGNVLAFEEISYVKMAGRKVITITVPSGTETLYIGRRKSTSNCQVELGSTNTEYEAYQGSSKTITFTDQGDPLTVYGGTVTLNEDGSVDLVSNVGYADLGDYTVLTTAPASPSNGAYRISLGSKFKSTDDNPKLYACNQYLANQTATWSAQTNFETAPDLQIRKRSTYSHIIIKDTSLANMTAAQVKEALRGVYLAYPLATPITYHFSSIGALESFVGTNTVWHDMNDSITVEYYKFE